MAAKPAQKRSARKAKASKSSGSGSSRSTKKTSSRKKVAKKAPAKRTAKTAKKAAKKTVKKAAKKSTAKKTTRKTTAERATTKKATAKKATTKKAATKTRTTKSKAPVDRPKSIQPSKSSRSKAKPAVDEQAALAPNGATAIGSTATSSTRAPQPEQAPKKIQTDRAEAPRSPDEPTTEELWTRYRTEVTRLAEAGMDEQPELPSGRPAAARNKLGSPELEAIRNALIERYHPLVRYIAERLLQTLPKSIELDDLISAGLFGLMDAIRGFDPDRGIKFKTYCSTRIRGSILDQLRSQDWVPRLVRLKAGKIEKALQQLTGEFGREPTHAELARALKMDHGQLSEEMRQSEAKTMFSLSEKWDDEDDGSIEKVEILEDHDAIDPVQELNRRDLMRFITRALTHKERFIIEQYYQYGHTMREIGEMLTLTESRVCQIHSNVMNRLKDLLDQRTDTLVQ